MYFDLHIVLAELGDVSYDLEEVLEDGVSSVFRGVFAGNYVIGLLQPSSEGLEGTVKCQLTSCYAKFVEVGVLAYVLTVIFECIVLFQKDKIEV